MIHYFLKKTLMRSGDRSHEHFTRLKVLLPEASRVEGDSAQSGWSTSG